MLNLYSPPLWRQVLRKNFTNLESLAEFLQLDESLRFSILTRPKFPLNIPLRLAEKIQKGTLNDPLLKQFLPTIQELTGHPEFVKDPVQDLASCSTPKLLHKYAGRALLLCTSACAMHCRYCFRQNYDYEVDDKSFDEEILAIAKDPSIHEVIFSGGDPLSLSDTTLATLFDHLTTIPHIKRLRFHTRFPIGIPERIDDTFLQILKKCSLPVWMVLHINHARELDDDIFYAVELLRKQGVGLLCHTVLLRGVNDSVDTLVELSETLIDHGILPYYLNQLDRVTGSVHFEVPEEEGQKLILEMSKQLPGFAVPRYVREIAGQPNKSPILPI